MILQKFFTTKEDLEEFLDTEKEWMFNRIYEAIEQSWYMGETYAEIFQAIFVVHEDNEASIVFTSPREDWLEKLEMCINFFVTIEEFEKCNDIKLLREEIRTHPGFLYNDNTSKDGNE